MTIQTVTDILRTKLINSQWIHPLEDKHYTVRPGRLTRLAGSNRPISIGYKDLMMPSYGKIYHIFQIGPYVSDFFNTPTETQQWVSFSHVVKNYRNFIQGFDLNGVLIDYTESWLWIEPNGNIIVAVEDNDRIDCRSNIYFRFFSPNYMRVHDLSFDYKRQVIEFETDLLTLQDYIETNDAHVICYKNGRYVPHITPMNIVQGDVVELITDPSIKDYIDFDIDDLDVFESEKDQTLKYLLHPLKDSDGMQVHYRDDLELYLYRKIADKDTYAVGRGRYFPRTGRDSLRMLTHRDYSVRTDDVTRLIAMDSDVGHTSYLRLYRRHSSTVREITSDGSRLFDLYRLKDNEIVASMLGAKSYYEGWKASNLESSEFIEYTSSRSFEVYFDPLKIMSYPGVINSCYDAIRYVREESGFYFVDVPEGYREHGAVCYLYNSEGSLVEWRQLTDESIIGVPEHVAYGEFITGQVGGFKPVLGREYVETGQHNRVYHAFYPNGMFLDEWSDVTGNLGTVEDIEKTYWDIDLIDDIVQVRDARNIVHIEQDLVKEQGFYSVDLTEEAYLFNQLEQIPIFIGYRNIEVFLNGKLLVWNEGYRLNGQRLYILDHELIREDQNTVLVRMHGMPDAGSIDWVAPKEIGYIEDGMLSKDGRYDLIDDQVTRIVINGTIRDRATVFLEEESGSDLNENGRPYELRDYAQPLYGLPLDPYKPYLDYVQEREGIENQLHIMHVSDREDSVDTIPARYANYSPLMSKLLYDARTGGIDLNVMRGNYDDRLIYDWLNQNKALLEVDPYYTKENLKWKVSRPIASYDSTAVDWYEFRLMNRANDLLFEGLYNLETALHMVKADV